MKSNLKVILPIIALLLIAVIFGVAKLRSDDEMSRDTGSVGQEDASLPEATGEVNDLFAAIDASAAQEDAYISADADTTPSDETEGFEQSFNENQI